MVNESSQTNDEFCGDAAAASPVKQAKARGVYLLILIEKKEGNRMKVEILSLSLLLRLGFGGWLYHVCGMYRERLRLRL